MYVCVCKGITDTEIREAVEGGANSFREVRKQLGISTVCGSCADVSREIIQSAKLSECDNSPILSGLFYQIA